MIPFYGTPFDVFDSFKGGSIHAGIVLENEIAFDLRDKKSKSVIHPVYQTVEIFLV